MIRAKVHVTLKRGILDPQGRAIRHALDTLGFLLVDDVRVGKYLELEVREQDPAQAEARVKAMCEALLVNPVIEDYRYELDPPASPP